MKFLSILAAVPFFCFASIPEYSIADVDSHAEMPFILHAKVGDAFPLKITLDGSVFSYESPFDPGEITVKKEFYMLAQEESFLFSFDKENWVTYSEFFGGEIKANLLDNQASIGCTLNFKL